MDRMRWLIIVTVFSAILPAFAWADPPMVTVEVAIVERTNLSEGSISVDQEMKNSLADADLAENGLVDFLSHWRTGTDETPITIQTIRVKTQLGARVEVQTQRMLDPDPRDEEGTRPDRLTEHVGMDAALRAEQTEDGQIKLECRFGKNTHDGGTAQYLNVKQDRMEPRPRIGTTQMTAVIKLLPGEAFVSDSMQHSSTVDGKSIRSETCYVYLAGVSKEVPSP